MFRVDMSFQYEVYLRGRGELPEFTTGRKRKTPGLDATRYYAKPAATTTAEGADPAYILRVLKEKHTKEWKKIIKEDFFTTTEVIQRQAEYTITSHKLPVMENYTKKMGKFYYKALLSRNIFFHYYR